ncbi:hypothetical protein FBU30_005440 [Linnemannia zychae]|nr:hypothetical protein FBU30_005440 [Linnemannia zychae]
MISYAHNANTLHSLYGFSPFLQLIGTKDPEFEELNGKFTTCERNTANLLHEVMKYRDNVTAMLNHQAEVGIVLSEIYDPNLGMSSNEVTQRRTPTAPESIEAVDHYQAVMREMRDILLSEVDKLELTVVRPLQELQTNMKLIRRTITKREHKLIDYDRFRISLKKLNDKKERSLKDEKEIYKLESQLEVATADYEGLNGLLKEELPGFFYYNAQLIEPIFNTFYYLQLHIYNIMLERITQLANSGYYNLTMNVIQGYEARKQDIAPTVESVENITRRSATANYTSKYARPSYPTYQEGAEGHLGAPEPSPNAYRGYSPTTPTHGAKPWEVGTSSTGPKPWQTARAGAPVASVPAAKPWQTGGTQSLGPPPAYNPGTTPEQWEPQTTHNFNSTLAQMAAVKKGPPPPVPKKIGGVKMAVALYDFDAQQPGDLSFRKDDQIEIVQKTENANEWWTGRLKGQQGLFPGTYVQEL